MTASTSQVRPDTAVTRADRERVYRRNFPLFLGDYVLMMIGFNLIGPTTVIPDFVRQLTTSEVLIGLASQMFEVGFMLPQLLVARRLLKVERKKWWFIGPNIPVRTFILIFAGLIVLLGPERPHLILALFLLFYGLAALGDGLVGVPWLDLAGGSLDSKRRAQTFGDGRAMVGVAMLGLAPLVRLILGERGPDFPNNYALLFALAGLCFLVTVPFGFFLHELPGGKAQASIPPLRDYLPLLGRVLRDDRPYRAMLITRLLATFFTLAGPFYIGFATEQLGMSSGVAVSNLLLVQTLGSVGGAMMFSRWGERRNLLFIRLILIIGILQPALALLAGRAGRGFLYAAFLAGGVVIGCLTISFINWVISYATPDERPVYTGLFNSISAVGLLAAPLLGGAMVEQWGYNAVFLAALVVMAGALFSAGAAARSASPQSRS